MSADSYSEITSQSWFSRIGGAIKGIIVGLILLVIAFTLLFWNEGRAVKRYKTLKEGGGAVISIAADQPPSTENEGRLVHVRGRAVSEEILTDPDFGVKAQALKLRRSVEMYQWQQSSTSQEKKKLGGGTETTTTYTYEKKWSSSVVNSNRFKQQEGHQNPDTMPYLSEEFIANTVTLGNFTLSPALKNMINSYSELAPEALPENPGNNITKHDNTYYIGNNPSIPEIGDLRIRFAEVQPTEVSIIAARSGNSFRPYQTTVGGTIELLQLGTVDASAMIAKAQQNNTILSWVLRAIGFMLLFFGMNMMLAPLSVLADVVPLFGKVVGAGTGIIAGLLAAVMGSITVGIAWLVYRPLIGAILLVAATGIIVLVTMRIKKASPPPIPNAASAELPPLPNL